MSAGGGSVRWLDQRSSGRKIFIDQIFARLRELTDGFISKTCQTRLEMPYGYGERAQVGHLAQAADRCGYLTIQDYDVALAEKKKKRYRPDLHIWVPERGGRLYTCCFEVKAGSKDWMPVDATRDRLAARISTRIGEANGQLSNYGHPEALYRCALVALRIWCCESKWKKWGMSAKTYEDKLTELMVQLEQAVTSAQSKPNFWWPYFAPYQIVLTGSRREQGKLEIPALGVFWVGSFRRS